MKFHNLAPEKVLVVQHTISPSHPKNDDLKMQTRHACRENMMYSYINQAKTMSCVLAVFKK